MGIPRVYRKSGERFITTFDFVDIASGSGNQIFYPYFTEDKDGFMIWKMSEVPLAVPTTTGSINNDNENIFETREFALQREVIGTATLTGFINSDGKITAKITKRSGELVTGTLGSSNESDNTEYDTLDTNYILRKTFTINGFRNKVTNEIKNEEGATTTSCRVRYNYFDNTTPSDVIQTVIGVTYTAKTYINPFPSKKVKTIGIYIKTSAGSERAFTKNQIVFNQDGVEANIVKTNISSEVSTPTYATNINFNLPIPLTRTLIKKGERLAIHITNTGSGIVIDPLNLIETTNASLKLNISFKIDL